MTEASDNVSQQTILPVEGDSIRSPGVPDVELDTIKPNGVRSETSLQNSGIVTVKTSAGGGEDETVS
jgi:hypothetical protein